MGLQLESGGLDIVKGPDAGMTGLETDVLVNLIGSPQLSPSTLFQLSPAWRLENNQRAWLG